MIIDRAVPGNATRQRPLMGLAESRAALAAIPAMAAHRVERENNPVACANTTHAGPHFTDDSRALVSHYPGERARHNVPVHQMIVAVTNAGTHDIEKHFSGARRCDIDVFDGDTRQRFVENGSLHLCLLSSGRGGLEGVYTD